ncbi:MAG: hypothetical protein RIT40_1237 [Planctomycetota bacterium]
MQTERNSSGGLTGGKHWSTLALAACGVSVLILGCVEHQVWTPYAQQPAPTRALDGQEVPLVSLPASAVDKLDANCIACHQGVGDPHGSLRMACVDCHGGDPAATTKEEAHPKPRHPERWVGSRNPERTYTLLNDESPEWIKFVNPGDLRIANETCGGCHADQVLAVSKSTMTTAAPFWGMAGYANGIVPFKRTLFGESYSREGLPQRVNNLIRGEDGKLRFPTDEEMRTNSWARFLLPLPRFEATQPANLFRVFEEGSRLGTVPLGQNGLPTPAVGLPDKLEDPGRPNNRLSDRGLGTLNRVDLTLLNVHKTRLNDPHLSFLGTNDQPGDYRSSGCTACHMVYANDRDPIHSGIYAAFGHKGDAQDNPDPTIAKNEPGHPIAHKFTNGIPSSQCMVCHMHQPNSFVNTFYGYQMWSYETDGERMWPKETKQLSDDEYHERLDRNPEGAAQRGLWGDRAFLENVSDLNKHLKHTQFADYHGHGWVFRAVFKTDRKGNLLDKDGDIVPYDDPTKFEGVLPELGKVPADPKTAFAPKDGKPVHLMDIHAERGMHCVDCHFSQDAHGDGTVRSEIQAAVQITCQDCHGDFEKEAVVTNSGALVVSGPSSKGVAEAARTPYGKKRFEERDGDLYQRSMIYPEVEWLVKQVADTIDPQHPSFNKKASDAKSGVCKEAHGPKKMECHTCHTSWMTSCFGCHLPQEANVKSEVRHFEGGTRRNHASYNPQVARDDVFMLGIQGDIKGNRMAPVRSSSAVMLSSKDGQRQTTYGQQMPVAANGMSSQCFNTHFAHTVRTTETKTCVDCHPSAEGDNNAWLAQTYLLGTGAVNFVGMHAWVGQKDGVEAVRVTEADEPQAVIGSRLHQLSYPEAHASFVAAERQLATAEHHGGGQITSLQLRGEYLYTAGSDGFRVYDVANIFNKGFSEKVVTAPVSPLGQDAHVDLPAAAAVVLPINNSISMSRAWRPENLEQGYEYAGRMQNLHESYRYAYVADREEGLVLVDVEPLNDGNPSNNFLERGTTFNPNGLLRGARNLAIAGTTVYICCDAGVVAVDVADPCAPKVLAVVGAPFVQQPRAISIQFRYAFVVDERGLAVLDVTWPEKMKAVESARVELADARGLYVARTWAYVAAGKQGLAIVDIERPERPALDQLWNADGALTDLNAVVCGMTNDSLYAYLADGVNGLRVASMVTPEDGGRSAYGFSPQPKPQLLATRKTASPALALSRGLDRDRAVDESGHQVAVFGRLGGRPLNLTEMRRLYLNRAGDEVVTYKGPEPRAAVQQSQPQAGGPGTAAPSADSTSDAERR